MFYKPEIRKKLRAERKNLDKDSVAQAAKQVAAQIIHLPRFLESKTIAFYLPQENELDTAASMQCAADLNKQLYLPVVPEEGDKVLSFFSYQPGDPLVKNRYDILEPDTKTQSTIDRETLDIIITPLVGFDSECNRLGRGAGYYDHTLSFINELSGKRPTLIGLGYEFQKISKIEPSKWDIPLDCVITEAQIYQRI